MVTEHLVSRARSGDGDAFRALVEPFRHELHVHCYRSVQDAEDVLQETLMAAWRGLDGFEGRASVRAWLYRIVDPIWLQPYPDALLGPEATYERREAISLAFVTAMQSL